MHAAGGEVILRSGSQVAGNASIGGHTVRVDGQVGGDLKAAARRVEITGEVDGDVDLQALEIKILPSARINGSLTYRSPTQAIISPDAQILGDVTFIQSERPERMMGQAFTVAGTIWLSVVASLILLGIVLLLLAPNLPFEVAGQIRKKPWLSLGLGLAVLVGGPIVMLILAVTGIGAPLAVVLAGLYVVVLALGFLDFAILVGWTCARLVGRGEKASRLWRIAVLAAGLVVMSLIALIPGLGALMLFVAFVLGSGAVVVQAMAMRDMQGAMS
jgi:cytoskeletal protein CcmA (bactofilin family)